MKNKIDFNYIDILITISCMSVVFLHTNFVFWRHPSGTLWLSSSFIQCFFYFAVPIFFMISGATLLDYRRRYNTKKYIYKRIKRTLIPFICWSLIGFVAFFLSKKQFPSLNDFIQLPISIINCKYLDLYWFFLPLFVCYGSIVYISRILSEKKLILFLLGWLFASQSIFPLISNLFQIPINSVLLPPHRR